MTDKSSVGLAELFGQKLGLAVLFFIHDKNVILRWLKRALLAGVFVFCLMNSGLEFAKTLTTLAVLILLGAAFAKSGTRQSPHRKQDTDCYHPTSVPREGPAGYGYYDGHGNFRGSSDPYDAD